MGPDFIETGPNSDHYTVSRRTPQPYFYYLRDCMKMDSIRGLGLGFY